MITMVCAKPAFSKAQGIVKSPDPIMQFQIDRIVVSELFFPFFSSFSS